MSKEELDAVLWWNRLPIDKCKEISGYNIGLNAAKWFAILTPLEKILLHRKYTDRDATGTEAEKEVT